MLKKYALGIVVGLIILILTVIMLFAIKSGGYIPGLREVSDDINASTDNLQDEVSENSLHKTVVVNDGFKELDITVDRLGKSFALSSDGTKMAYSGFNLTNGTAELWVCDIDDELNTANAKIIDTCPVNSGNTGFWNIAWSPNNEGIIYSNDENYNVKINRYTFKDGKTVVLRTVAIGTGISNISFGSISKKMFYAEDTFDRVVTSTFKTNNMTFTKEEEIDRVFTDTSGQTVHVLPMMQISPNEEDIIISSYNRFTNKYSIWSYNIESKKMDMLSGKYSHAVTPVWSPDGSYIAYAQQDDNTNYYIVICSKDGSNATKLHATGTNIIHPYWHPDGQSIFYIYEKDNVMGIRITQLSNL